MIYHYFPSPVRIELMIQIWWLRKRDGVRNEYTSTLVDYSYLNVVLWGCS